MFFDLYIINRDAYLYNIFYNVFFLLKNLFISVLFFNSQWYLREILPVCVIFYMDLLLFIYFKQSMVMPGEQGNVDITMRVPMILLKGKNNIYLLNYLILKC